MLTDVCNLKCPYCFANEFVNHDANEISLENFHKALDFITKDGCDHVGLIGGEPLLHSKIREILQWIIADDRIQSAVIYTNGIKAKELALELSHPKFRLLVNCNPIEDISEPLFQKMTDSLDELIFNRSIKQHITLGINFYKENQDYQYILDLLKHYGLNRVRMSVTVPNLQVQKNKDPLSYFRRMKSLILRFIEDCLEEGILPFYDCNKIPVCVWEKEEIQKLEHLTKDLKDKALNQANSIVSRDALCNPVIDILQDLQVVRCFGLSDVSKQSIDDFKTLTDLNNYYIHQFDMPAFHTSANRQCQGCQEKETLHCLGGCISYKLQQIITLKRALAGIDYVK